MARKPVSYLAGSMVIGTLVGVVMGVLSAPKSGKETRLTLKNRAKDVSKQVPQQLLALPRRSREAIRSLPDRWAQRHAPIAAPEGEDALGAPEPETDRP